MIYINLMVTTNQKPAKDTQIKKIEETKHKRIPANHK